MRPLFPRSFPHFRPGFACVLLLAAGGLGACDRHSATEVPESYGHGSSHERNFDNHQIDSRPKSQSFSDTQGLPEESKAEEKGEHKSAPGASPGPSQPGRFFPNGS